MMFLSGSQFLHDCSDIFSFEQFDVVLPKKRLTSFGIAVSQERWQCDPS